MDLHGKNFLGSQLSAKGSTKIYGYAPGEGRPLVQPFIGADEHEAARAIALAAEAAPKLRTLDAASVVTFLRNIATEIEALGEDLIDIATLETGLPKERLTGERARTTNQLRMFADLVHEGSFVDARIDTALPDRKPVPRPDLRRMLIPVGPVVVFGASNFPFAFSVAGGDTAAAFASRNPVVVKAHPAHPGTSELTATAILRALEQSSLPEGTFSMIHSVDTNVSLELVKHPETKAVAFTGSLRAGRAIFDAAGQRSKPIPAYVEMGSTNPVFLLPGVIRDRGDEFAQGLFNSVNLGVGQFCTCPGLVIGIESYKYEALRTKLSRLFKEAAPGTMLYPGILNSYTKAVEELEGLDQVEVTRTQIEARAGKTQATPALIQATGDAWLKYDALGHEVFGPATITVACNDSQQMLEVADKLAGTLTASIHGTPEDLITHRDLISVLESKAGRVLFNGFPTGVEVSPAMHHGGPYPATADPKFTSVGTASILRFLRPICYQNFPSAALPPELLDDNPRGIWRLVNGEFTRDSI